MLFNNNDLTIARTFDVARLLTWCASFQSNLCHTCGRRQWQSLKRFSLELLLCFAGCIRWVSISSRHYILKALHIRLAVLDDQWKDTLRICLKRLCFKISDRQDKTFEDSNDSLARVAISANWFQPFNGSLHPITILDCTYDRHRRKPPCQSNFFVRWESTKLGAKIPNDRLIQLRLSGQRYPCHLDITTLASDQFSVSNQ